MTNGLEVLVCLWAVGCECTGIRERILVEISRNEGGKEGGERIVLVSMVLRNRHSISRGLGVLCACYAINEWMLGVWGFAPGDGTGSHSLYHGKREANLWKSKGKNYRCLGGYINYLPTASLPSSSSLAYSR